jgi:4-hydroxybenzoate polyprenyltransferase
MFSKILHSLTVIFWALFVVQSDLGIFGYIAILASIIMLTTEHIIVHKDYSKIDRAFFTINGYLGILFFILIVCNYIFI